MLDRNDGAGTGLMVDAWLWPGMRAHRSALTPGMYQHFFAGGAVPLDVTAPAVCLKP